MNADQVGAECMTHKLERMKEMNKISPGWAVELVGEMIDLDDFRELLSPPFNPWVEDCPSDDGVKLLLRSISWASLSEAADMYGDACRILECLNGEAMLIHDDARPVKLGEIMRFGEDGKRHIFIFPATGRYHLPRGRARGRGMAVTSGPSNEPQESRMQRWFREAETDDTRAELFAHLARTDNWYDLYKSMELARKLAGRTNAVKTALGPDSNEWTEWKRTWQTANCYRHAPDPVKYPLPSPPVELQQARNFILKMIPRLL
jgi:hypothetical protein